MKSALITLNKVGAQFSGKEQSELKRISCVQVEKQLFQVSSDYLSLALLQHWAFLIEHSHGAGQRDERVFRLLDHVTDYMKKSPARKHYPGMNLYFEFWLLALCGEFPVIRNIHDVEITSDGKMKLKKSQMVMSTNGGCSEADRLLLQECFKQTIEQFVRFALQYGVPNCLSEAAGSLWRSIINRKLVARKLLMDQFREKEIL